MTKNHYDQQGFSVWDIIKAYCPNYAHLEFCAYQGYLWGNIVKYLLRCGWKENLDGDLEKAANYLQRLRQYREQLQCQEKKPNALAPDAGREAGTTTGRRNGSASTVIEEELLQKPELASLNERLLLRGSGKKK